MPDLTSYDRILFKDAEASLPSPTSIDIPKDVLKERGTLVVLDDDPQDITVLTTFEKEVLIDQFKTKEPGFFVLTNTRAFHHNEVRLRLILFLFHESQQS